MSDPARDLLILAACELEYQARDLAETGSGFNLIPVLRCDAKELSHSGFIAELLSPNGSHRQGRVFLDAFLEVLEGKAIDVRGFPDLRWVVSVEKATPKDADADKPGRIDIALLSADGAQAILIENKIYAGDQHRQLKRYVSAAKGWGCAKPRCLYLTLDGKPPTPDSLDDLALGRDVWCISYEQDISEWLDKCGKLLSPACGRLGHAIEQYQETVYELTKWVSKRDEALVSAIADNLEAAHQINDLLSEVNADLHFRFWKSLQAALNLENLSVHPMYDRQQVKDYHDRFRRSKEHSKIGLEVFQGQGPKLKLRVHDLWYSWDPEECRCKIPLADGELADGRPWKHPIRRLNFARFDPLTRAHLAEFDKTIECFVREIQGLLAILDGHEG